MKKSSLARLQQQAQELEQINDSNVNALVSILENTFSAIATAEPKMALSIIDQLVSQKKSIQEVATEREANAEAYVRQMTKMMSPMIEFEDEDEDN